jgi:hypothetical protein
VRLVRSALTLGILHDGLGGGIDQDLPHLSLPYFVADASVEIYDQDLDVPCCECFWDPRAVRRMSGCVTISERQD